MIRIFLCGMSTNDWKYMYINKLIYEFKKKKNKKPTTFYHINLILVSWLSMITKISHLQSWVQTCLNYSLNNYLPSRAENIIYILYYFIYLLIKKNPTTTTKTHHIYLVLPHIIDIWQLLNLHEKSVLKVFFLSKGCVASLVLMPSVWQRNIRD